MRELLHRLESPGPLDPGLLAELEDALRARGQAALARWVHLELEGYGPDANPAALAELLDAPAGSELVQAVVRARVRHGRLHADGRVIVWPHFFVEALTELQALADRVGRSGTFEIVVEFGSSAPRELAFPRGVFHEVVKATRVELADAVRKHA